MYTWSDDDVIEHKVAALENEAQNVCLYFGPLSRDVRRNENEKSIEVTRMKEKKPFF